MLNNILILKNNIASHCETITYPDDQNSCKIDLQYYDVKTPITIKCRIKTFSELEMLLCIVAALKKYDRMIHSIEFIYLFGTRSDRAFSEGEPNYFRDVIAPIINSLDIPEIHIAVPHNFYQLVHLRGKVICKMPDYSQINIDTYDLIGGDKNTGTYFDTEFVFYKQRNDRDNIVVSLSERTLDELYKSPKEICIIDDLCDGGATFIAEAQYLKQHFPNKKLNLFIVHGIFSKGFDELLKYFDRIYTTNSYDDFNLHYTLYPILSKKLTIIDIWNTL